MRVILVLFFSASLLVACKNSKPIAKSNKIENKSKIELNVPKEVKQNGHISFEFANSTFNEVTVHAPAFKHIERQESGKWIKVKILYCPCGADCIPPPKTKTLKPGETHKYSWNLTESWCDKKKTNNIQKTIERKSTIGIYRTTLYYSLDGIQQEKLIKEFNIIN